DRAVCGLCDLRPCLRDAIDEAVVVLRNAVAADERIDPNDVDLVFHDGALDVFDHWLGDHKPAAILEASDDDWHLAAAIEEQAPLNFLALDVVKESGG